jgi:hypothetical protein
MAFELRERFKKASVLSGLDFEVTDHCPLITDH